MLLGRKQQLCCRLRWLVVLSFLIVLICSDPDAVNSNEGDVSKTCETEDDLDFESCNVEDLEIPALKEICAGIGLSVEEHIFPYLLHEDEDDEDSADADAAQKEPKGPYTKADYVSAAYECLALEEETEEMLEGQNLTAIMSDVIQQNPELVEEVERELMAQYPDLWSSVKDELDEGETLKDRPEILHLLMEVLIGDEDEEGKDEL